MRFLIFVFVLAFQLHFAQAQFELSAVRNQNECKWYVKNTGTDTVKLVSVSMRFFHNSGDIVFTPPISFPSTGKYQYQGSYYASGKFSFKNKTILIQGLDNTLSPGGSALLSTTTNSGLTKDTIIVAGVKVYYSVNGGQLSADAFPAGVSPCPSEPIFVNAGVSTAGIKYGSAASQNLHFGVCEPQLVAIVFDANSLLRKPVSGHTPHCTFGKKWTTFGNPDDYQIYYTFDISTQAGQLAFDTFASAISIGDYVAITNTQIEKLSNYNGVKNALKSLGFDGKTLNDVSGYFVFLGKKGANPGEAIYDYCEDPHGACATSIEHSISSGDFTNAIRDFSLCYEDMYQVLDNLTSNKSQYLSTKDLSVYPNPAADGWFINGLEPNFTLKLFDFSGRLITLPSVTAQNYLTASGLPTGAYLLSIFDPYNTINRQVVLLKQ